MKKMGTYPNYGQVPIYCRNCADLLHGEDDFNAVVDGGLGLFELAQQIGDL